MGKSNKKIDKQNKLFLMFCSKCGWKDRTVGLQYRVCPKCGHINIDSITVLGGNGVNNG